VGVKHTDAKIIYGKCGASLLDAQGCVKEYALSEAATSAGTTRIGPQDAGELLCCLPDDLGFSTIRIKRMDLSWSRWKVGIHGAEEDEHDNLNSLSKLFWPAAIALFFLLRSHLPLRGQRSFALYKLFFNRRPKLKNEHVLSRD
jgi:hypothetical protein